MVALSSLMDPAVSFLPCSSPLSFSVLLGRLWSGSLSPFPASSSKRFLSSERWVVERCDGIKVYRVQYFNQDDHFYAQVAPTNLASVVGQAYLRFKRLLAPPA